MIRNNYVFQWDPFNPSDGAAGGNANNVIQPLLVIRDTYGIGAYASEEYQVRDDLKLVAACRWDKNTQISFDKNYVSPRAAVIYRPVELLTTKLIFNTATRLPQGWQGPLNAVWGIGNPAAPAYAIINTTAQRPEVLSTLEWQNIINYHTTRAAISLYYQRLKDFISWGGPFTNVGDFTGYGAELSVKSYVNKQLMLWGNASFTRANFTVTSNGTSFGNVVATDKGEMAAVPALTANVGTTYELVKGYFVSPTIRYFTHQPTWYWTSNTPPNGDGYWGYSDNRVYVDVTGLATNVIKGLDVSLIGSNILNNTSTVAAQYLQGRYRELGVEVMLQLTYHAR
jgi:hypothetical protein